MNLGLERLDKATQMLAEANTLPDVKQYIDMAEAARVYARQIGLDLEQQNHFAEAKIRGQRKAGQMLRSMVRQGASRPEKALQAERLSPPTLSDIGIDYSQSHRWQQVAALPDEDFEEHIQETKNDGDELTTSSVLRKVKDFLRQMNHQERPHIEPPNGKYRVFYADPPWSYGNANLQEYGHASFHYPAMSIGELCELPVRDLAEENAVLFLWVTSPLLEESFEVIKAWGFKYKTSFVWDKVKHNFGHYNSVRHEFLLVCTRGSCTPDVNQLFDSVQSIERGEHSEKPEEFRTIIDTLYVFGRKIELFARNQNGAANDSGWAAWGNEARSCTVEV